MAYQIKKLVEEKFPFNEVFTDKQKFVAETSNMHFTLGQIVDYLRMQTNNFTVDNPVALDLDKAIYKLVMEYQNRQVPSAEPEMPGEDSSASAESIPSASGEPSMPEPSAQPGASPEPLPVPASAEPATPAPATQKSASDWEKILKSRKMLLKKDPKSDKWKRLVKNAEFMLKRAKSTPKMAKGGDVSEDNFRQEAYEAPFKVEHSVYAKGGGVDSLSNKEKNDIDKRFKKWLNYEPKIKDEDVTPIKIREYVTEVLSSTYMPKQHAVEAYLLEKYGWEEDSYAKGGSIPSEINWKGKKSSDYNHVWELKSKKKHWYIDAFENPNSHNISLMVYEENGNTDFPIYYGEDSEQKLGWDKPDRFPKEVKEAALAIYRRSHGVMAAGGGIPNSEIPDNVYWALYAIDRRFTDTEIKIKKEPDGAFVITNSEGLSMHIEHHDEGTNELLIWNWLNGLKSESITVMADGGGVGELTNQVYIFEFQQYGQTKRAQVRTEAGEESAKNMIHMSYGIPVKEIKLIRKTESSGHLKEGIYDFITVKSDGGSVGGSGWGSLKKGKRIKTLKGLKVGDILLNHSNQFNADNVVRITNLLEDRIDNKGKYQIVYGILVNPDNTSENRMAGDDEFAIWDFTLKKEEYYKVAPISAKLKKQLLKHAKEDVEIAEKEGGMSVTETKHGVIHLNHHNGIFTISNKDRVELFKCDKKGAINFVLNSYTIEYMKKGGKVRTKKKLATLTVEEDKAWVNAFEFHVNKGVSDSKADKAAWEDLKKLFPRLKDYDGIKPDKKSKGGKVKSKGTGKKGRKAKSGNPEFSAMCDTGTEITALRFDKKKFTAAEARSWAKKHGFKTKGDDGVKYFRARIKEPKNYKDGSFRTTNFKNKLPDGIMAVVACPK